MDDHDFILEDTSYTYMKYVPDLRLDACGKSVPEELELVQEDLSNRKLWSWSSLGRLRPEWQVSEVAAKRLRAEPRWKKLLRPIRDCYTMLALMLVDFDTPAAFMLPGEWPLLQVELVDYIHANSIAWVGQRRHLLVSARHLDTVFMIERTTGNIIWALGGPMSRMTERRPIGDPDGGFSHQHGAIIRNNVLYLFDNGNNLPGRPSRVVAYAVNTDEPGDARFLYQFTDPAGLRRPSEGSVEPLPSGQLLVGWGRPPEGEEAPQRAVSIFDPSTSAETFSIDFNPGWSSYRAKYAD